MQGVPIKKMWHGGCPRELYAPDYGAGSGTTHHGFIATVHCMFRMPVRTGTAGAAAYRDAPVGGRMA
jgi:hypothetical protein